MSERIKSLCNSKPVAIFGNGASGIAAKKLLDFLSIKSVFYAEKDCEIFDEQKAKNHSLVVYSPAFRPNHSWIEIAIKSGAVAICEPDLSALAWSGKIFAITGTNGKTTLTKFLTKVLNDANYDAIAAGNIGQPLSAFCVEFGSDKNKIAVCELSSFQTSNLKFLKPDALLWTNFAPDHLDWHINMREYLDAKMNLVRATENRPIIVGSSVKEYGKKYSIEFPKQTKFLDESNPPSAPAPFNSTIQARNFYMAEEFAKILNISNKLLKKSTETFELPSYRFAEPILVNGVRYYNDSKATNAHAAIAALEELNNEENLIWIGGGKDKLCDLTELTNAVVKNAKSAVLIGQTAQKLKSTLDGKLANGTFVCETMADAVKKASELAKEGSAVLFSPAFSSFGMFSGYAERGKSFKNEVLCLKNFK